MPRADFGSCQTLKLEMSIPAAPVPHSVYTWYCQVKAAHIR